MKTSKNRNLSRCAGFSMVEVLVASTILVVIVVMLGMLFQQTSLSWRVGVKRADGFMQVRALIGAIQRDASAAVDARFISAELKSQLGGDTQSFTDPLKFYTLSGTTEPEQNADVMRALKFVTYNLSSGARTEDILKAGGGKKTLKSNVLPSSGRVGNTSSTKAVNIQAYYGQGNDLESDGLPMYITFQANVSASGASLDIGAASAGPDKIWGTKDDIKTWVK